MIIGESFVWIHFPKCAGTTTTVVLLENFATDPTVEFDATDTGDALWHETVREREQRKQISLDGKDVLANTRRLPAFVVSKIQFTQALNPKIQHTREHYLTGRFFEADGFESSADFLLGHYDADRVSHWLRTEHLKDDFVSVFSRYLDLDGKNLSTFSDHINSMPYDRDIVKWYSREEMAELYRLNRRWSAVERRVYGNLLYEEIY